MPMQNQYMGPPLNGGTVKAGNPIDPRTIGIGGMVGNANPAPPPGFGPGRKGQPKPVGLNTGGPQDYRADGMSSGAIGQVRMPMSSVPATATAPMPPADARVALASGRSNTDLSSRPPAAGSVGIGSARIQPRYPNTLGPDGANADMLAELGPALAALRSRLGGSGGGLGF